MNITSKKGIWSFQTESGLGIDHIITSVVTDDEMMRTTDPGCIITVEESQIHFSFSQLVLSIRFLVSADEFVLFDCQATNISSSEIRIRSITPMEYCGDWNARGTFTVSKNTNVYTYPAERSYGYDGQRSIADNQIYLSFWFASFHDYATEDNFFTGMCDVVQGCLKYHLTPLHSNIAHHKVLQWSGEIDCHSGMRGVRIEAGKTFSAGTQCMLSWKGDHHSGLEKYARFISSRMNMKFRSEIPAGWCSWYTGYAADINEEEILKNLECTSEITGIKYFQIDDGWMIDRGTRTEDEPEHDQIKFPHGMKWIAEKIRAKNLIPGIWIRPFQGWGDGADIPLWARGDIMDLSHPECLDWLKELIHRIVHEWGYKYIKFDFVTYDFFQRWGMNFLRSTTVALKPFDDSMTNIQMFRRALEGMREAAGDDCFLLGCNCLIGPATGMVDGLRIGDDVSANDWNRTLTMGVKSIAPVQFLNRTVWWNDPDCMMFHEPMHIEHVHMWANFVMFTGGMRIISSKIFDLDALRKNILIKVLALQCRDSRPVYSFELPIPEVWYSKILVNQIEYEAVGIFNWNKTGKDYRIKLESLGIIPAAYTLVDYWNEQKIKEVRNEIEIRVEGGRCKILYLKLSHDH